MNMKFVRFGSLSLQRQIHYEAPVTDMYPSSPPAKKGVFAFPAGYSDPFYLPLSRPPEDPHSLLQYLRDDNGAKITKKDLYDAIPKEEYGLKYDELVLSEKGLAFLKKKRLKEKKLFWVKRPSYVMVYPDPKKDLTFYGLDTPRENRGRLNQTLTFLLDPDGDKIETSRFFYWDFYGRRFPEMYEGGYRAPEPEEDFNPEKELYYGNGKTITVAKWLKKNHVRPEQLCVWPCYAKHEDEHAATLKRYRVFEYNGCLWHHLGMYLKRSEILSQFADTWYYTDMHAYERALRKSDGMLFRKRKKYQREMTGNGYFCVTTWNGTFDLSTMYEVFFDEKLS